MLLLLAFLIVIWWLFWRTAPVKPPVAPSAPPPEPPPAAPETPVPPAPVTMVTQVALDTEPESDVPVMVEMPIMAGAPAGLLVVEAPAVVAEEPAPVVASGAVAEVEEPAPVEDPVSQAAALPTPAAETADDFTLIEGVRPKISEVLHKAGLLTFAQLSTTSVEQLREILNAARLRVADPTTWPEQAALAAAQQWDELKALQAQLKGGKRAG